MTNLKEQLGTERYAYLYERHGSPWDRGGADSYYRRDCSPHYYVGATASSEKISRENMTKEEIAAYYAGYEANEEMGNFKDWG